MPTGSPADAAVRFALKPLVFLLCLVPFALLAKGAFEGDLGANPLERVTDVTGEWGLYFLLITLSVSPLRRLSGWIALQRFRRMLGLFAFFYISLHLLTWVWLDQELLWDSMIADIVKRPYITVGFLAWLLLVPLAATSTRGMMKRLGRRWGSLHQAIYVVATLGVLHYLWLVKADILEPVVLGLILVVLLATRWKPRRLFRRRSSRSSTRGTESGYA